MGLRVLGDPNDRPGQRDLALVAVPIVGLARLVGPPVAWLVALGVDGCREGWGSRVAGVGRYGFRLVGAGVDMERLAGVQSARIRAA